MTITELMNKRAQAWDAAKKWLDEKTDENGMMTAEDAQTYDRMEADIKTLSDQIERRKRADELEEAMNRPVRDTLKTNIGGGENREKTGRASDEYREAFWTAMRIGNTGVTPEIRNALQVGTDSEGGYLVPEEFERTLIKALDENNIFRKFAKKITTGGDRLIPTLETRGTASWIDEEAAYPESDVSFGQKTLGAYKLATLIKISDELLADSAFNMSAFIASEFGRRMGRAEEEAFFTGSGTNKPTGILDATNGAAAGVTAAAENAIVFNEIIDLYHSLKSPYRPKAIFIVNDDTVKNLRKIKDTNGQYVWQPSVSAGTPDTLLGRAVYTSEFMPKMAAGNAAVLFGDLSNYWIADRGAYSFKRLNELYAATGQVGFRGSKRVDGKLILSEAVKTLKMKAAAGQGG